LAVSVNNYTYNITLIKPHSKLWW